MSKSNKKSARKFISLILGISVVFTQLNTNLLGSAMAGWGINPKPQGQGPELPQGLILKTSPYQPLALKGLKVYSDNPLKFDFLLEEGDTSFSEEELKAEAKTLIEYFLACLTLPEDELWVNLSPFEKDKIIPEQTGLTEMGKGLLEQDYLLKKLTASLMYPETELGKEFWQKVYQRAYQLFKTTKLPVNTFNKVWIIPDKAVVYEDGDRVVIGENHLKVMLESDYLALKNSPSFDFAQDRQSTVHSPQSKIKLSQEDTKEINDFSSQIVKEVIIPAIEEEVNSGKNFATLRQMYSSFILATWFKKRLKQSLLGQAYVDKRKVAGIDTNDPGLKESIYQQYLSSYKDGIYNYIKSDYSTYERKKIKRRYYSGGVQMTGSPLVTTNDSSWRYMWDAARRLISVFLIALPLTIGDISNKPLEAGSFFWPWETAEKFEHRLIRNNIVNYYITPIFELSVHDELIRNYPEVQKEFSGEVLYHLEGVGKEVSPEMKTKIEGVFKSARKSFTLQAKIAFYYYLTGWLKLEEATRRVIEAQNLKVVDKDDKTIVEAILKSAKAKNDLTRKYDNLGIPFPSKLNYYIRYFTEEKSKEEIKGDYIRWLKDNGWWIGEEPPLMEEFLKDLEGIKLGVASSPLKIDPEMLGNIVETILKENGLSLSSDDNTANKLLEAMKDYIGFFSTLKTALNTDTYETKKPDLQKTHNDMRKEITRLLDPYISDERKIKIIIDKIESKAKELLRQGFFYFMGIDTEWEDYILVFMKYVLKEAFIPKAKVEEAVGILKQYIDDKIKLPLGIEKLVAGLLEEEEGWDGDIKATQDAKTNLAKALLISAKIAVENKLSEQTTYAFMKYFLESDPEKKAGYRKEIAKRIWEDFILDVFVKIDGAYDLTDQTIHAIMKYFLESDPEKKEDYEDNIMLSIAEEAIFERLFKIIAEVEKVKPSPWRILEEGENLFRSASSSLTKGGIDFLDEKFFKLDTQGKGMDISYEPARLQDFDISRLTIGEIVIVNPKKN